MGAVGCVCRKKNQIGLVARDAFGEIGCGRPVKQYDVVCVLFDPCPEPGTEDIVGVDKNDFHREGVVDEVYKRVI